MRQDTTGSHNYEEQLQLKLREYHLAEAEGRHHAELLEIYKQIKELQLQAITATANYQYWSKRDNPTDYRV